jgi:S-DNA-T family DNA segregation ATPase FtsK/SpoIIIE
VRRREALLRNADARQHGEVFLVIDGWAGVRQEFDGLEDAITAIAGYAGSAAAAEAHLTDLAVQLTARLPDAGVTQRQLRERSWWSGPDMYVVVDDYELVAGAARNPLTPLLELLPHARDLGLHVIVARRAGGAARAMFDPVLTGLRDLGCLGLMMSATPDEGVLLGSVRPSPLPQGRATVIRRGHPDQLVQVAWTAPP